MFVLTGNNLCTTKETISSKITCKNTNTVHAVSQGRLVLGSAKTKAIENCETNSNFASKDRIQMWGLIQCVQYMEKNMLLEN